MKELALYFGTWVFLQCAALVMRFSLLRDVAAEERFPIGGGLLIASVAVFALANVRESRRLITEAGLRGRGTFGYIRGWITTAEVDIALDESQISRESERRFRTVRISSQYALLLTFVVAVVVIA